MGRNNIFNTTSVEWVVPPSMRQDLVQFLVSNRNHILSPTKRTEAFRSRYTGGGLISELVNRLTLTGKDQVFNLINLPSKTTSLREVVDMTFIPFDLLQLKDVTPSLSKTLSVISELDDKIIINITDLTRANGEFADVSQFQWRVVRDFLSRSFYKSSGNVWISPALVRYVAKVYSMTIGGAIARQFGLTPLIQTFIQTIFCLFYVTKMTNAQVSRDMLTKQARLFSVAEGQELAQILAFVEDTLDKPVPETLEDVLAVIDAYGFVQLKDVKGSRLTRPVLNAKFQTWFPESHVSTIALEYPPYFLFLLMLVISGQRIGLAFPMKQMNLVREGKEVMDALIRSPSFTNGI